MSSAAIEDVIAAFARGDCVLLLDDLEREGEADILQAAVSVSGPSLNWMATVGRGLITVATDPAILARLDIRLLEPRFCVANMPRFAEPIDYSHGTTTGVSAYDRAATIRALADPRSRAEDFARPGHVLPIAEAEGGLAKRRGHTEGAVALARLCGLPPAVAMCELMGEDGRMAKTPEAIQFCRAHGILLVRVAQIADHPDSLAR